MSSLISAIKHSLLKSIEDNNISESISEYLELNGLIGILDSDFLAQEIIENFDIDSMCDDVEKVLIDKTLTFRAYPSLNENTGQGHRISSEYCCPTCYRVHGQWEGFNKVAVNPNILKNGKSIIVAE